MSTKPKLALVGERDLTKTAHQGIEASLALYRQSVGPLAFEWLGTAAVTATALSVFSGIWCVPGSPCESTEGAVRAIQHARLAQKPFLGTCGGFQHALVEYAQNVLAYDAEHQELNPAAQNPLITRLSCSLVGTIQKVLATTPDFETLLGGPESLEEFNCNYGVNDELAALFEGSSLAFVARDEQHQIRAFQLQPHPFFIGTLFQPERCALKGELHPLMRAFFQATAL